MVAAKLKSEQIEEIKEEAGNSDLIDATKIEVEDNFDLDDI